MMARGPSYLAGPEATDVSAATGIPWYWGRSESRGRRHPMIDLLPLDNWDRFRVTWALIAGYAYLEATGIDRATLALERKMAYWINKW